MPSTATNLRLARTRLATRSAPGIGKVIFDPASGTSFGRMTAIEASYFVGLVEAGTDPALAARQTFALPLREIAARLCPVERNEAAALAAA
jgi:hypothetical protein